MHVHVYACTWVKIISFDRSPLVHYVYAMDGVLLTLAMTILWTFSSSFNVHFSSLLHQKSEYSCLETDVLVFGLQESPSPVSSMLGIDPVCTVFVNELVMMEFVLLTTHRVSIMPGSWGLLSMVFVKRSLLCYFTNVKLSSIRTGVGGLVGNKGASIVKSTIGDLDVCFVNCHLPPHEEGNGKRLQDLNSISTEPCLDGECVMTSDVVVLYGDLNFRLEGFTFDEVVQKIKNGSLQELLAKDQLQVDQVKGSPSGSNLKNFLEANISFPPSYKYLPNSSDFSDGGKGRVPSWCDRILWAMNERLFYVSMPTLRIVNNSYVMCAEPSISDHRAVASHFTIATHLGVPPPVVFEAAFWERGQATVITFEVVAHTEISSWDWIGLYPRQFGNIHKDYVFWTYTPAKYRSNKTCTYNFTVPANSVPTALGHYILLYFSRSTNSVIGMSPSFRIER